MNKEGYSANFLWGFDDDSIEYLGYEFANAKTEAYQKEVWTELVEKIKKTVDSEGIPESDVMFVCNECGVSGKINKQ